MRHNHSNIRYRGFIRGATCGLAGMAAFSVIEAVLLNLDRGVVGRLSDIAEMASWLFVIGSFFALIPAGVGGAALGALLNRQMRLRRLTPTRGFWSGALLAGLVTIFICVIGLVFLSLYPHNGWYYFLAAVKHGSYQFYEDIQYGVGLASRLAQEIIIAVVFACIAGGWAGRKLAIELLRKPQSFKQAN